MKRHLGLISLIGGVISWLVLTMTLLAGGLDPSNSQAQAAQVANGSALVLAFLASILALIAILRGPQRVLGALGLAITALFLLVFTGSIFALLA